MIGVGRFGKGTLGAYFVLVGLFLYTPLVILLIFAFNNSTTPTLPLSGFTTKWFHAAFSNGELTDALRRSAELALANAFAATLLGLLAALGLSAKKLPLRPLFTVLLLLPLVVPYIVLAIGMVILLHQMHIQISLTAVFVGHVVISLPYAMLVIMPRLRTLDDSIPEAARDLGASELVAFVLVTLPLLIPSLVSSLLITFTISFDEFAIASFLAPAGTPTYPVFLYGGSRTPSLLPELISIGTIVIACSILLVLGAELGRRRIEHRIEGPVTG